MHKGDVKCVAEMKKRDKWYLGAKLDKRQPTATVPLVSALARVEKNKKRREGCPCTLQKRITAARRGTWVGCQVRETKATGGGR